MADLTAWIEDKKFRAYNTLMYQKVWRAQPVKSIARVQVCGGGMRSGSRFGCESRPL